MAAKTSTPPTPPTTTSPTPTAPAAAEAPKARAVKVPEPTEVALELPMLRHPAAGYQQRRIDVTLDGRQAQAWRDLFDGLEAAGEFGARIATQGDAIRYLLNRLADASEKALGGAAKK